MMAPPLVGSNRVLGHRDYVIKTLLHGMTGPLDGRNYGVMVPMGANSDEWVASVASYIRSGFGTTDWLIAPADVAKARADTANRTTPWTLAELERTLPRALIADATWTANASHNPAAAGGGVNFSGWSSDAPQTSGMWYQIELPSPVSLTEIQFESPPRTGRGAPPVDTYPRNYQVQISEDGQQWSAPVARGTGSGPDRRQLRADAWKVHPHLADGVRPRRSDVDDAQHPVIRGAGGRGQPIAADTHPPVQENSDRAIRQTGGPCETASCAAAIGRFMRRRQPAPSRSHQRAGCGANPVWQRRRRGQGCPGIARSRVPASQSSTRKRT